MRYVKIWLVIATVLVLVCASPSALAFRTDYFPAEYRNQALIWIDQKEFFENEDEKESERPIWLQAGDSISSGFGSSTVLNDLVEKAQMEEKIPFVASLAFFRTLMPGTDQTWYAGTALGGGVLGGLEKLTKEPWVIYSTALAGTQMSNIERNPLLLADEMPLEQRKRVKLITLSLGTNDLCDSNDPFLLIPDLHERSERILKTFPNAARVGFRTINPLTMQRNLMDLLDHNIRNKKVPAKKRAFWSTIKRHCQVAWYVNCRDPNQNKISKVKPKIDAYITHFFGENTIDFMEMIKDKDLLQVAAADCFHPSRNLQGSIVEEVLSRLPTHFQSPPPQK